jgi:hypothetical protein
MESAAHNELDRVPFVESELNLTATNTPRYCTSLTLPFKKMTFMSGYV